MGLSSDVSPAFRSPQLRGITHEPLLCYLLVLSGFATANWEQAAENPNRIYKTLVDSIWHRGWGEGEAKRQGPRRTLSKADFNVLMQTIALAAWQGGETRVASEQSFMHAVKIAGAETAWENFKNDNGPDVTNLAMNFYLKAAEIGQRGFEFTHKTFGDYLAARAILDIAEDLQVDIRRKIDHAMTDWVAASGTGSLSREILTFLRDEVRLRVIDSADKDALNKVVHLKKCFEQFLSTVLADGLPASANALSWRVAETRQRNAETMAWVVMNALSLTLAHVNSSEKLVRVEWPDEKLSLQQLIKRLSPTRSHDNSALGCFSYILLRDLVGLFMMEIDLRGAQMVGANFAGSHLIHANLQEATLDSCNFQRAMLDMTLLDGASLKRANLRDAWIDINTTTKVLFVAQSRRQNKHTENSPRHHTRQN
jgi:Pentapeptide repeats (8 copies)